MRSFRVLEHDGFKMKTTRELYERIYRGNSPSSAASKAATVVFKTSRCEASDSITLRIQEVSQHTKNGQDVVLPVLTKDQKPKEYTYTATWNDDSRMVKLGNRTVEFVGSPVLAAVKVDCSL